MVRIAIYSRKSIETDVGESIKNQIKLCREYFEKQYKDCKIEVFEDEGYSGGNINRPDFQRMMELIKIKQFNIIAVYKIDRIARNIVDFINIYDSLDKLGVTLVSITEGFDPSTPVGKMMMMLLASFAEMERMNIAQRVKDNMKELAKMGRWSGGTAPTGYCTIKAIENEKKITYLKLIDDEAFHIQEIFKLYASGQSTYSINKCFATKGFHYPTKTIMHILRNPTYLKSSKESASYLTQQGYSVYGEPNGYGFLPYNRRPRVRGKKISVSTDMLVGVSKHEPIIELDTWIKVHQKLKENSIEPHPRESDFSWLAGLVKCRCGSSMFIHPGKMKQNGSRVYYFRCSGKRNKSACNNKFLRVDDAENSIMDHMKKILDKDYLTDLMNKNRESKDVVKGKKILEKSITNNNDAINSLVDKLILLTNDASIPVTTKIELLTKQNISLKEELLMLERTELLNNLADINVNTLYDNISKFINCNNDIQLRKYYIKTIIKMIIWDCDKDDLPVTLLI